jgi:formate hydrogenlyase subunit 3/multisubunit Na+/H+ antiporter MnhD subunit
MFRISLRARGRALGKILILVGLVLVVVGLLWMVGERFGLGRLPGDIVIERDGWSLYIPLATSLVISVVLSLLLWLFFGR